MSRVGQKPIPIPSGVTVAVERGNVVKVKGPKGELSQKVNSDLTIEQQGEELVLTRPTDQQFHRSQHGLARSLINNMVVGVTAGFTQILEVHGVGYRAQLDGRNLSLQVGKSHPVIYEPPKDTQFEVSRDGRTITITGIDKEALGQLAAVIRMERPPEPYKGKGIRYQNEYVRMKAGKAGKAAR